MDFVDDEKYIVFKRSEFFKLMGELALPPWEGARVSYGLDEDCAPIAENIRSRAKDVALKDAVVIRRQDKFASPCLLTYAAMIGMVAEHHPNRAVAEELLAVADYFHQQGVLAGEEGTKLPTV